jgi:APA family basic amino acid/polyamine antiporter
VLVIFAWYTLAMIVLYFVYGMHNSQLHKGGLRAAAEPDLPVYPEDAPAGPGGEPTVRP